MGIFKRNKEKGTMSDSDKTAIRIAFSTHLIRHKILAYVLWYKDDGHFEGSSSKRIRFNKANALKFRTVCKSWLWSVTFLLRKYREPLFKLDLTHSYPLEYPSHCFTACLKVFKGSCIYVDADHGHCKIPPFSLSTFSTVFMEQNKKFVREFLEHFGKGLVKLSLFIISDEVDHQLGFVKMSPLPILERLTIRLCRFGEDSGDAATISKNLVFLQDIIQCMEPGTMHKVHLHGSLAPYFSDNFVNKVIAPIMARQKITDFHMECSVNQSQDMQRHLLLRDASNPSGFSNITSLRLYAISRPFEMGLLYRILLALRQTLKDLQLEGDHDSGLPTAVEERSVVKLPQQMTCLKSLKVMSNEWYPCKVGYHRLETWRAPQTLKTFHLTGLSEDLFRQWTENCKPGRYSGVESVNVRLLKTSWGKSTLPLTPDKMANIHQVFPNVVHLTVSMIGTELDGIKYIFREMRKLQSLEIRLMIGYHEHDNHGMDPNAEVEHRNIFCSAVHWDGVLIGATSTKLMLELNRNRLWGNNNEEFQASVMGRLSHEESIRNLAKLKSFCISTGDYEVYRTGNRPSLISELAFEWGFNRMPNLKELELRGNFRVNSKVRKLLKAFHEERNMSTEYVDRACRNNLELEENPLSLGFEGSLVLLEMFAVIVFVGLLIFGPAPGPTVGHQSFS